MRAAFAKLTDQKALARVAADGPDHLQERFGGSWYEDNGIRLAAVRKLADQEALLKLALQDKRDDLRTAAVETMKDQALLAQTVLQSKDREVRRIAIDKLTDQSWLCQISIQDEDPVGGTGTDGRFMVLTVKKLTDQALLAKVVAESKVRIVRYRALQKLTDQANQAIFARMAVSEPDDMVRGAAIAKLTDEGLLVTLAIKDQSEQNRGTAIWHAGERLGPAQAAVKLTEVKDADKSSKTVAEAYQNAINHVCSGCIWRGNAADVPALKTILQQHGDAKTASLLLNSGQADLRAAGEAWAAAHGFSVVALPGAPEARWGGR